MGTGSVKFEKRNLDLDGLRGRLMKTGRCRRVKGRGEERKMGLIDSCG